MSKPLEAFRNAFRVPELKRRILFTVIMMGIYRLGCHVPTPGIDGAALTKRISTGGMLGFYDIFSGGAFSNATVFALGIMPYISASIILSLLVAVIPALEKLQKAGAEGQKKITEYTRYGTIGLCVVQSIGIAIYLQRMGESIVANPGYGFIVMCIISFTTGTAFIMWIGEQISEYGLGNGMSLVIFAGIVSRMPNAMIRMLQMVRSGDLGVIQALVLLALLVVIVAGAILVTTGQRRIPVQYPRQVKGRKVTSGGKNYLPLRVNQAGVIPIIFASSILMLPGMLSGMTLMGVQDFFSVYFGYGTVGHGILYAAMIIFFSFFYTAITFNPIDIADNLKKYGGVIVGVRPGKSTADYLNRVMTRITLVGSLFLTVVALLPAMVYVLLSIPDWNIVHFFGGTSLLILVGVALDTIKQIEQHLTMRHYDGFSGKSGGRIRSRRGG